MDFNNLYTELHELNSQRKGYAFEEVFKGICLDFFINDSTYNVQFDRVELWNDWEYKFSTDLGIDLVAREVDSENYWAIQCKFYNKNKKLSISDLNNFLGLSSRQYIQNGKKKSFVGKIIVTTCNEITSNLEITLSDQKPQCLLIGYNKLEKAHVDWDLQNRKVIANANKDLRPYQKEAINNVIKGFQKDNKGKLIMACGTGKTFTSVKIVEELNPKSVLYLVPSLSLLQQTINEYSNFLEKEQRHLIVCSDTTIKTHEQDSFDDIVSLGLPSTNDPKKIENFLQKIDHTHKISFVFSTYQSLDKLILLSQKNKILPFDLVLCDEAHRTTGLEGNHFTKILDDSKIKRNKTLFMTATPRIYTDVIKQKAKVYGKSVSSMDDTSYGKELFKYDFTRAIQEEFLCDYRVAIVKIKSKLTRKEIEQNIRDLGKKKIENHYYDFIAHIKDKNVQKEFLDFCNINGINKIINFTNTIKNSKNFTEEFNKIEGIEIDHIDGKLSGSEKYKKLQWLKDGDMQNNIKILSNAKCLTEGVDVPNINGILFLEPKGSIIDIIQSVGRAIRLAPDKSMGYIILPIIVPDNEDEYAVLETEDYKKIWQVLKALRSYDGKLDLEINNIRFQDTNQWNERNSSMNKVHIIDGTAGTDDLVLEKSIKETAESSQGRLFNHFNQKIRFEILDRCGDRDYIDSWASELPNALRTVKEHLEKQKNHSDYKAHIKSLKTSLAPVINPNITEEEIKEILIQHILTIDIFESIFSDIDFTKHNPIARELKERANAIFHVGKKESIIEKINFKDLEALKSRAKSQLEFKEQKKFLLSFYEKFYQAYNQKAADKLGIVYTPEEVVEFMIKSTDELLKKHFNTSLIERDVNILDPCTGTGNFIYYLLHYLHTTYKNKKKLAFKYDHEIFASELSILSYYIASLCIEKGYFNLTGEYKTFEGIVYQDTLDNVDFIDSPLKKENQTMDMFGRKLNKKNLQRRDKQNENKMTVIIGNPPYNANQANENQNNKPRDYNIIDQRIKDTYTKESSAQKSKTQDMYARFIRWASDRITDKGILAFITNSSFIDSKTFDGFRNIVQKEFDTIYVVDLHGNVRGDSTNKISGSKHNIFGIQTGVCITFLIKTESKNNNLYYHYVLDYYTQKEAKLKFLKEHALSQLKFEKLKPKEGYWLDTEETDFKNHLPIVSKNKKEDTIFMMSSLGVVTNRDLWVYDLDKNILEKKAKYFIDTYNQLLKEYNGDEKAFKEISIKWSSTLKNNFKSKINCAFKKNKIINSIYRPFTKILFHSKKLLNDRLTQSHYSIFGKNLDQENVCITFNGRPYDDFYCLSTQIIYDLEFTGACKGFPLYTYTENNQRQENITNWALEQFQEHYKTTKISKIDIFYYIYAVFNNENYTTKYKIDLQRNLPRIPFYKNFECHSQFGKELMDLHLNFEKVKPHQQVQLNKLEDKNINPICKVKKEEGVVELDSGAIFTNIPKEAFDYKLGNRSPVEWVVSQHKPKNPSKKELENYGTIFEKFNTPTNELKRYKNISRDYLIDLIPRLVTLSLETVKLRNKIKKLEVIWKIANL